MDDPLQLVDPQGVFLRREALEAGYTDKMIAAQRRAGHWHRVRHGAYCLGHLWQAASPEQRHLIVARAVLRLTPGPVVLSHTTALLAHGVAVWGADLRRVHVTRLDQGAGRSEIDVEHHVGVCPGVEVTRVRGLPIVRPARAVIEAATLLTVESVLVSADSALHRRLCTNSDLRSQFESMKNWPGSRRVHVILHHADGRAESPGETRSRFLFWRNGLPRPVLQFHVYDETGRLVGITDFAWPEHQVLGEFDGRVKYSKHLRPGETPADAVFREKRREDRLRSVTGWPVGRLCWEDLATPWETAERFRALMRRVS